jgi:2-oxoisovalerate dehydrogenase E1 component subunit alpha
MKKDNKSIHKVRLIDGNGLDIPTLKILQPDGTLYKTAKEPPINKDTALNIYQSMLYIRVLDERMVAAQRQGRLSFYLTCTGEEAAAVGSAAALKPADMIMGQYREQGALRYRGFTTEQFMGQLLGNEKDLGKGRQMPVHYGSRELNYMTISSPLATQIPQAAGYAYGQKLAGKKECTLCYFGEGAASEGDFHAGLNIAAVRNAPVIFVCRNNGYAISTPTEEQFTGDGIASRGVGYGIETIRVDGNDILAVYAATVAAREFSVNNNKPVLVETMSYRLGAHSTSDDPSGYRSKAEEDVWREKDPIERMKNWLLAKNWWSASENEKLLSDYRTEVLAVLKKVEKYPPPPISSMISDVYDLPSAQLRDQFEQLKDHLRQYPEHYPKSVGRV